jgi:hypothetical protein
VPQHVYPSKRNTVTLQLGLHVHGFSINKVDKIRYHHFDVKHYLVIQLAMKFPAVMQPVSSSPSPKSNGPYSQSTALKHIALCD